MDGLELIQWAVEQCAKKGERPTDANILIHIREWNVQPKGFEQRLKEAQYGPLPLNSANRGRKWD